MTRHLIPLKIDQFDVKLARVMQPQVADEKTIILPEVTKELYPLMLNQFIAVVSFDKDKKDSYYFFGIDDRPFVSILSPNAINAFNMFGIEGFYDSLKPWVIKECASDSNKPVRQGDIWAIRIAESWGAISKGIFQGKMISYNYKVKTVKSAELYYTRHRLTGELGQAVIITSKKHLARIKSGLKVKNLKTEFTILGCGELTAPDHEPLDLRDGIYALTRSIGISRGQTYSRRGDD